MSYVVVSNGSAERRKRSTHEAVVRAADGRRRASRAADAEHADRAARHSDERRDVLDVDAEQREQSALRRFVGLSTRGAMRGHVSEMEKKARMSSSSYGLGAVAALKVAGVALARGRRRSAARRSVRRHRARDSRGEHERGQSRCEREHVCVGERVVESLE